MERHLHKNDKLGLCYMNYDYVDICNIILVYVILVQMAFHMRLRGGLVSVSLSGMGRFG